MPVHNQKARSEEDIFTGTAATDATEYSFEERVGRVAQALDAIRYEDGVEYTHAEEANEYDAVLNELRSYMEQGQRITEEQGVSEELKEYLEKGSGLVEELMAAEDSFSNVKYNGETESGPGAFIVMVDGPAEAFAEYANEKEDGKAALNGTYWGKHGIEPYIEDPDLAQLIYETMEHNDGAIIIGEDGFLPKTYHVPDTAVPEGEYPEKGGTKHRAAVNAVYADLGEEYGDVEVESLVLSATDGFIRRFQKDVEDTEFPYDKDVEARVPAFWEEG